MTKDIRPFCYLQVATTQSRGWHRIIANYDSTKSYRFSHFNFFKWYVSGTKFALIPFEIYITVCHAVATTITLCNAENNCLFFFSCPTRLTTQPSFVKWNACTI